MNPPTTKTEPINFDEYKKRKWTTERLFTQSTNYPATTPAQLTRFLNTLPVLLKGINDIRGIKAYNEPKDIVDTDLAKEESSVDWQERYIDKLDRDVSEMKASLKATEDRIAGMINQTLGEMRDRDNQRDSHLRDLNNQRNSDMRDIRNSIAEERRWIIAMAITTIIGVAAMVVAVLITR